MNTLYRVLDEYIPPGYMEWKIEEASHCPDCSSSLEFVAVPNGKHDSDFVYRCPNKECDFYYGF